MPKVQKLGRHMYRVEFNKEEQEAIKKEARELAAQETKEQVTKWLHDFQNELDGNVLMTLHQEFAFGKDRLKRFHHRFCERIDSLTRKYELIGPDGEPEHRAEEFLATQWMSEYGIDLDQWNEEIHNQ